jgi:hypothetical protein
MMDVQMIAQRAQLSARKIRYILDQRILPGVRARQETHQAGQPRFYTKMEGFFIAFAALMLEGGVQRKTIIEALARLVDMPWPFLGEEAGPLTPLQKALSTSRTALEALYNIPGGQAEILIGDGVNLRFKVPKADTGWFEPRSLARLAGDYRPLVVIQLDLGSLKSRFHRTMI